LILISKSHTDNVKNAHHEKKKKIVIELQKRAI